MKNLEGKVAIVTGSGQGIGRGIAIYLAREGAKVITNNRKPNGASIENYNKSSMPVEEWAEMRRLAGDAESTAALIKKEGGEALAFYGDVADPAVAENMVNTAIDTWGRIDIVVNNAAGLGSGSITSLTEEKWDYMTVPKMKGAFNLMHFAVPHMMEQKFGRIFNCSSDAWTGLPDNDAYSAGNAGIVGLTWAAAKELYRHGITVNAYCPQGASPGHAVEYNKMLRNVKAITGQDPDPKLLKVVEDDHGDPVNLGPFFAYLSTEDASYISGEVFSVKSSGKIARYQYPVPITHAERPADSGFLWKVEELKDVFKQTIMGDDYVSHAAKSMWS
ncbi:MAG: SDR family oxidoreductase [Dorea sp.]|nr:SDR family oxidoreductase [Dorea sp.]